MFNRRNFVFILHLWHCEYDQFALHIRSFFSLFLSISLFSLSFDKKKMTNDTDTDIFLDDFCFRVFVFFFCFHLSKFYINVYQSAVIFLNIKRVCVRVCLSPSLIFRFVSFGNWLKGNRYMRATDSIKTNQPF